MQLWVAQLMLPGEYFGAGGGGFGGGDVAELLQEDGEAGVGEGVVGVSGDPLVGEGEGLVELAGVFEGADQGVGRGGVGWIESKCSLEVRDGLGGRAGGHGIEGAVEVSVGGCVVAHSVSIDVERATADRRG